jgi:acetyl/propionyl-CoA carboxylase alpha subunit
MVRALREFEIEGLTTLLPFHEAILQTEQWARGETCRDLVEDQEWLKNLPSRRAAADIFENGEPTVERVYGIEVSGKCFEVKVIESMKMENEIRAHRTGTIAGLLAVVGSSVAPGDTLALIPADEPDEEDIIPARATRRRSGRRR